jgi:hypothetical protein
MTKEAFADQTTSQVGMVPVSSSRAPRQSNMIPSPSSVQVLAKSYTKPTPGSPVAHMAHSSYDTTTPVAGSTATPVTMSRKERKKTETETQRHEDVSYNTDTSTFGLYQMEPSQPQPGVDAMLPFPAPNTAVPPSAVLGTSTAAVPVPTQTLQTSVRASTPMPWASNGLNWHATPRAVEADSAQATAPMPSGFSHLSSDEVNTWGPVHQVTVPVNPSLVVASIMHKKEISEEAIRRRMAWEEQSVIMLANWMKANPSLVDDLCHLWRAVCSVKWTKTSWAKPQSKSRCPVEAFLKRAEGFLPRHLYIYERLGIFIMALANGATGLFKSILGIYDADSVTNLRQVVTPLSGTDQYIAWLHIFGAQGHAKSEDAIVLCAWGFRMAQGETTSIFQDMKCVLGSVPASEFARGQHAYVPLRYLNDFSSQSLQHQAVPNVRTSVTQQPHIQSSQLAQDPVQPIQQSRMGHFLAQPVQPALPVQPVAVQPPAAQAQPVPSLHPVQPAPPSSQQSGMSEKAKGKQKATESIDDDKAPKKQRRQELVSEFARDPRTGKTTGFRPAELNCIVRTNLGVEMAVERPRVLDDLGLCAYSGPKGAFARALELHFDKIIDDEHRALCHSTLTAVEHGLWNADELFKRVHANGYTESDCNVFFIANGLSWGRRRTEMRENLTEDRLNYYDNIPEIRARMFDTGALDQNSIMPHDIWHPEPRVNPALSARLAEAPAKPNGNQVAQETTSTLEKVRFELARQDKRHGRIDVELERIRLDNKKIRNDLLEASMIQRHQDERIRRLEHEKRKRDKKMKRMAAQLKQQAEQFRKLQAAVSEIQIDDTSNSDDSTDSSDSSNNTASSNDDEVQVPILDWQ